MTRDTYGDGSHSDGLGHTVTCRSDTQAFCCGGIVPHGAATANCAWYGTVPTCNDNRCPDNKINVKNNHFGDSSTPCNAAVLRAQCCDHPTNLPFFQARVPPHSSSSSSKSSKIASSTQTSKSTTTSKSQVTTTKSSSTTKPTSNPPSSTSKTSSLTTFKTTSKSSATSKSSSTQRSSSKTSNITSQTTRTPSESAPTSTIRTSPNSSVPSTSHSTSHSTTGKSQTSPRSPTATPTTSPQELTDEAQKAVDDANEKAKDFKSRPEEGPAKEFQTSVKKATEAAQKAQAAAKNAKNLDSLVKSLGDLLDSLAKAEAAASAAVAGPSAATAAAAVSAAAAAAVAAEAAHEAAKPSDGPSKPPTTSPPSTRTSWSSSTSSSSSSSSSACPYCVSCADATLPVERDPSADSGDSPADAPNDPTPNEGSNPEDEGSSTIEGPTVSTSSANSTIPRFQRLEKRASRVRKQVFVCGSRQPINGPIYTQGNSGNNFRSYGYEIKTGLCSKWTFELLTGKAGEAAKATEGTTYATEHVYEAQLIDTFLQWIAQKKADKDTSKRKISACKDVIGGSVLLNKAFPGVSTRGNPGVFNGKTRPIVELAENLSGDDYELDGQSEMVFLAEYLNVFKLQHKFDDPKWADAYREWEKEFLDERADIYKKWKNRAIKEALDDLNKEDQRGPRSTTRNMFRDAIKAQETTGVSDAHFTLAKLYAWN
ncbi:MAG: hypothetical protein M1816_003035 [Peltula sp. TS41687]|nr:MAG: hypothetical protein M1816_003035 [Peltula sp. TS41687]